MAIIGAILGDIAGSKWEFNRPKDLDYEHIELFQDDSYYTDDTVLSVATKYALENEVSFKDAYNEFGNDYIDCGYGDRFFEWLIFKSKKPYKSCGNGSAMSLAEVYANCNNAYDEMNNDRKIKLLKKSIKHCRNPLEKKGLEKQLNKAYKERKKQKHEK